MLKRSYIPLLAGVSLFALNVPLALAQSGLEGDEGLQTNGKIETIIVSAHRATRQVQAITAADMAHLAPGTSPIRAVALLPGVNVTAADPFGAYEWAVRISARGFNQNQLGFTLDDIPLGDMSYGNYNGLDISRALIDENLSQAVMSQGTGALGTASTSNLGGTLQFYSAIPSDKFGGQAEQGFGSDETYRTFVRIDSGDIGNHTKFYVSAVRQDGQKWKGVGDQKYYQVNAKIVHKFENATWSAFFDYSNRQEVDYQDLSKNYVQHLGYNFDNSYPNWAAAIQNAQALQSNTLTYSPSSINSVVDPGDAAYYAGSGLRTDYLGGTTLKWRLSDSLDWKTTFYGHGDSGRGLWFDPYQPTPASGFPNLPSNVGSPISLRTSEYGIERFGVLTSLVKTLGDNTIETGIWYEHNDFDLARRFYGTTLASPTYSVYDFPTGPYFTQWAYSFDTYTLQGFIEDTYRVTDALTVTAGFKGSSTVTKGTPTTGSTAVYASGTIGATEPFLPQLGINWAISPSNEIFADIARNMRAFQLGGPGFGASPWGTTAAGFNAIQGSIKPETSWNYELGYRFKQPNFMANATIYYVDFSNRLLAIQNGAGIVGNPSVLANVGSVTTTGAELSESWAFADHFSWYNGATFNYSSYDDSYTSNGVTIFTKGKVVVDSPKLTLKTDLGYQLGGFYAHVTGDYMGSRYYSYIDDASVPARLLWDLGASYDFGRVSAFTDLKLQFNVYNLFDKQYYSSLGTNGFPVSDAGGFDDTLQIGSPRTFFGSISAKF